MFPIEYSGPIALALLLALSALVHNGRAGKYLQE